MRRASAVRVMGGRRSARRGAAHVLIAMVATFAPLACQSDPPPREATMPATTDARSWTGFATTTGLELVASDDDGNLRGPDRSVRLALRGPAADVERALAAARFTPEFAPGVNVFETALPDVDLTALVDPESAEDRWANPEGKTLTRKVVRGGLRSPDGAELIHVWAFTT